MTAVLVCLAGGCGRQTEPPVSRLKADQSRSTTIQAVAEIGATLEVAASASETSRSGDSVGRVSEAANWSNWRGPAGRGIARNARLPEKWPAGPLAPRWQVEIGSGFSSPVVSGGSVFITDRKGGTEGVVALSSESGEQLWEVTHPVDFDPHQVGRRHGNGPKSTPAVVEGRVFALGIAGMLECIDAQSGQVLWSINLPKRFGRTQPLPDGRAYVDGTNDVIVPVGDGLGAPAPLFGYTGSPAVVDDLLILEVGGERGGTLMALEQKTGDVVWQSLDENVSYSSPVVAELASVRQVVAMTGPRVVGLALDDGHLLWSHPFQIQYDESIGTPAAADDTVVFSGASRPLVALRIERDGESVTKRLAWQNRDLSSYTSSPLIYEGHVYGMNDDGEFGCVRLSDGETLWLEGNHGFNCSPVAADGKLLGLADGGELFVLDATPTAYRLITTLEVADRQTWTVPAVVGNRIYVRSEGRLACFEFTK